MIPDVSVVHHEFSNEGAVHHHRGWIRVTRGREERGVEWMIQTQPRNMSATEFRNSSPKHLSRHHHQRERREEKKKEFGSDSQGMCHQWIQKL
jgi:hypothetical protein